MKVKKDVAMLNWLHPKNTIDVYVSVVVVWLVSFSLLIVVEIIVDTTSDKVWFLVSEVVSTTSYKVWVTVTIVVDALFDFSSSSAQFIFPSLSSLPFQI